MQLQRQLGLSRHETARLILQKLRRAMVAPERSPLRGEVEFLSPAHRWPKLDRSDREYHLSAGLERL
jgi:hypothetical protein